MAKQEREADRYIKDKWYKNIWYHYKIPICLTLFFAVTLFFFIYSSVTKDETDLYVMYITEDPEVYTEKISALQNTLALYTEDVTGDGEVVVFVDNIYVGSVHEDDVIYENKEKIMTTLRAGTCMLVLCDDVGLDYLIEAEALCDLAVELPDMGVDGYFYDLGNSEFAEKETMPEWNNELYIALRVYKGTIAEIIPSSQTNFEYARNTFENILNDNVINGDNSYE